MIEGEERIIKQVCRRRVCEKCDEPATAQLTFVLPNARHNPASSAYGGDDISHCQDAKMFVCSEHGNDERGCARELGMEWCSKFPYERFPYLFLYWEIVKSK